MTELQAAKLTEQPGVKIVMLTMSEKDKDLYKAIKSGACGYLLEAEETEKFLALLSGLKRGEVLLSAGLARRFLEEFARQGRVSGSVEKPEEKEEALTPRQIEVLTLVAQGLSYKEVGGKLFLSEHTINYHMREIMERLQLSNRRQVIEYARRIPGSK